MTAPAVGSVSIRDRVPPEPTTEPVEPAEPGRSGAGPRRDRRGGRAGQFSWRRQFCGTRPAGPGVGCVVG